MDTFLGVDLLLYEEMLNNKEVKGISTKIQKRRG